MIYFEHHKSDFLNAVRISKMPLVYVVSTPNFEYVKIGRTKSFKQRMRNLQSGCPFNLVFMDGIRTPKDSEVESCFHDLLSHVKVRGEWFAPDANDVTVIYDFCFHTNKHIREVYDAVKA